MALLAALAAAAMPVRLTFTPSAADTNSVGYYVISWTSAVGTGIATNIPAGQTNCIIEVYAFGNPCLLFGQFGRAGAISQMSQGCLVDTNFIFMAPIPAPANLNLVHP